jgi:hypothetical protein
MLRRELQIPIKEVVPTKDKVFRANEVAPIAEDGRVSIYANIPALGELLAELCAFPYTKHNDFVDSFCMGLKVYRDEIMGSAKTAHGGSRIPLPQLNHSGSAQRITARHVRGKISTRYI